MTHTLAIASKFACFALISVTLSCASTSANAEPPYSRTELQPIINPEIPEQVILCERTVNLDREDMYERYDRELTAMCYTHGNILLVMKRANKYFPVIEPILKKNGIPHDFVYLAAIESNLNPRAYSPAKAAGIWQFIPSTAKEFGLEVSDEVDERYNLEKATAAACKFLKRAHNKYGNWESVMASYNGGMARISKELDAQLASSSFDLYLTEETSRYVFRVMAMKQILENPEAYGFFLRSDQLYKPEEWTEETVSGPVADWPTWAQKRGITYAQLREANPWIRAKQLTNKTGKTYTVKIPTKSSLSRKSK